ncbi:hypothetical protein BEWA_009620 [Theileria equi strain WA]|uniref:B-block binding subunit of TFIIIC domain-containing protein n=1 Tax=Theileria equi strain WA TaxID=1537102 RepID=L0B225_THEEQ|nr:hypothetical protein BEWA_009620 [Theileria equi strain WA]AFZ81548.1 hypothetical protein BEWA_009620 [Theileria equi strain WA]|eukprot:XP_004831214.1 hypothetical protein BEWA_009620 [Theileria equi strain WA]
MISAERSGQYDHLMFRPSKKRKGGSVDLHDTIDLSFIESDDFEKFIDSTRLTCSNRLRICKLNLVLYEQVVRSSERFRILLLVASKRYAGCWQSDLMRELSISPKELFVFLNSLCKLGLIYKLNVPHNRISKCLLKNTVKCYDEKAQGSSKKVDGGASRLQNSSSLCFYAKYFVIDKLPEHIRSICFRNINENAEIALISMLEREENHILLESDWKAAYFKMAMEEIKSLNTRIENYIISRSYISFRKLLESKNKISRTFAWCPQTGHFERCIMLYKGPIDDTIKINLNGLLIPNRSICVINLKKFEGAEDRSEINQKISPTNMDFSGHSAQEYIYYVIKLSQNGAIAKDINRYVPIKYRQLSKILFNFESTGLVVKETERSGKTFMYRYYVNKETQAAKDDIIPELLTIDGATTEEVPSHGTTFTKKEDISYPEFLSRQRLYYTDESVYVKDFDLIFGKLLELPKQVNTIMFKRRMVLFHNYIDCFKAATFSNIAAFYNDMENLNTNVDRKTVVRVSQYVVTTLKYIKKLKSDKLKGTKLSVAIVYDSRYYNDLDAYNYIRSDIVRKRNILSSHAAALKSKINDSFKNLEDVNSIKESSIIPDINQNEIIMSQLNIQIPSVVKNISVNQQNPHSKGEDITTNFSQKLLSSNGFIFPIVTRIRRLHLFLTDIFSDSSRFSTLDALNSMNLELFFQLIGCGYEVSNINQYYESTTLIRDLPDDILKSLSIGFGRRDPVQILNNLLNFLLRMKLLLMHEIYSDTSAKCIVEWELVKSINLHSFLHPDSIIGTYDLLKSPEIYWNSLKIEVDNYINGKFDELPSIMHIKEIFVRKNWKRVFYLSNVVRNELDMAVSNWLKLSCNRLNEKSLLKCFHVPFQIVSFLSNRFNVPSTQIFNFILNKIKSNRYTTPYATDDLIVHKIIRNISKDSEYLWLSRFVIAERLCNAIFQYMYTCKSTMEDGKNGDDVVMEEKEELPAQSSLEDIWKFMSILFEKKYTPEECVSIFDYILNKSTYNSRLLKRLRKLASSDIITCALNCNVPMLLSCNKTTEHHQDTYITKLKSLIFTPAVNWRQTFSSYFTDTKKLKIILKSWVDRGWIVRTKKKTHIFGKYKLNTISKIKLFGKFSDLHFYANVLISNFSLFSPNNNLKNTAVNRNEHDDCKTESSISKCLDMNIYSVYNLMEQLAKEHASLEPRWSNNNNNIDKKAKYNYARLIDGGITKHINGSSSDTLSISSVEAKITDGQIVSENINMLQKDAITKDLVCGNQITDILNPLESEIILSNNMNSHFPLISYTYSFDPEVKENKLRYKPLHIKPLESRNIFTLDEIFQYLIHNVFDDFPTSVNLEAYLYKLVDIVRGSEEMGISYSNLMGKFRDMTPYKDVSDVFSIVLTAAQLLRFVLRLATGAEYTFIYWEYGQNLLVDKQRILYDTQEQGVSTCIQRPEYISPLFWILWEDQPFSVSSENLNNFIGSLQAFVSDSQREAFVSNFSRTNLAVFTSLDGHLNRGFLAFVSLRIFFMLKEKPGQTLEEVWKELVILDECEVEMLLESMVSIGLLLVKSIESHNVRTEPIFIPLDLSDSGSIRLYYAQESSITLWKFRHILVPFLK